MPWEMMVDSRATTGLPSAMACATSGLTSRYLLINITFTFSFVFQIFIRAPSAVALMLGYSMIVPSGTMVIHPVRMSGTVIGAPATYDYFKRMQDRIIHFITTHCDATYEKIEELMMNTQMLTKDVGTILVGKEAVDVGLINEIGGIAEAFHKLKELIRS